MKNITIGLTNAIIKRGLVINSKAQGIGTKLLMYALHTNGYDYSFVEWEGSYGTAHINNKLYHITAYDLFVDKVNLNNYQPTWLNWFCPKQIILEFEEIN